jgi:hypothetical protein
MLSMNGKRFGLRTALGAVALGLGLAGAVSVSASAKADGWHHMASTAGTVVAMAAVMAAGMAIIARGSPSGTAIRITLRSRGSIIPRPTTTRRLITVARMAA